MYIVLTKSSVDRDVVYKYKGYRCICPSCKTQERRKCRNTTSGWVSSVGSPFCTWATQDEEQAESSQRAACTPCLLIPRPRKSSSFPDVISLAFSSPAEKHIVVALPICPTYHNNTKSLWIRSVGVECKKSTADSNREATIKLTVRQWFWHFHLRFY